MGEIAALATSLCWSLTSIQFTMASQRAGSRIVNRMRLLLAVLFLVVAHLVVHGTLWPRNVEPFRWGWLGLSGIIGLMLGDGALYQAFLLIGTHRSMLLMTLAPVISALLAWGWFGEQLQTVQIAAILLTMGGIAWVVSERREKESTDSGENEPPKESRRYVWGVLCGIGGALGQAVGLVLSKRGLTGGFDPLSATLVRMIVATGIMWLIALLQGQAGKTVRTMSETKAWTATIGGALTGPAIGVWFSMLAIQHAQVGIASTLMSLSPIMLIPLSRWFFGEHATPRSVAGTAVAMAGATVLFLT